MKVRTPLLTLLEVAFVLTVSAQAFAVPILSGTVTFIGDGGDLVVDVMYTVYAPGDSDSPLNTGGVPDLTGDALVDPDFDVDSDGFTSANGLYTYFYELANASDPGGPGVSGFTLGVEGHPDQYVDIGYLDGSGNVAPLDIAAGSGSVITLYLGDFVLPGETSDTLFITSAVAPGTVYASIINGGMSDEHLLPAPVPEPSSMLLLGSLASGLIAARRSRARKKA